MDLSSLAWVAVIPALGLLILVHELGHFLVAIKMGIKVLEFGIGYPPRMLTLFERNGVKYTLNWLPLGGFVRMQGEEGNFESEGSLAAAPPHKKIPVMLAGVVMNMITAIILFAIIFAVWGKAVPRAGEVFIRVVTENSAAHKAGIQPNDRLVKLNDQQIQFSDQVRPLVQANPESPIDVTVERNGELHSFKVTPTGNPPLLGVRVENEHQVNKLNPFAALWEGTVQSFRIFWTMIIDFGTLIGGLLGLAQAPEGSVAGPIGIARITGEAAKRGMEDYLSLTALLSINLALINILPIPALDGSRIVFALIEWVRRGRKIAPEKEALIHAFGMLLLLGLMVLISISDIGNAISGKPALP